MLAFKTRSDKVQFPIYVQPKLNGVRALYLGEDQLQSRDEHLWDPHVVGHLLPLLNNVAGEYILDGELYLHGMSLQQINSRIAVNRAEPHPQGRMIEYHVFDVVADAPMAERVDILTELMSRFDPRGKVKIVSTFLCTSEHQANCTFALCKREGYEGVMYRKVDAPYGFAEDCSNKQNRWWYLQKRKDWMDIDCCVIGLERGQGRLANTLGAFLLQAPNGAMFSAGSGLTDQQRQQYWSMSNQMVGKTVKIKFEMLSDTGVPLKPTILLVES